MYVLFDIGGTKTRVSASADLKEFCEPVKFETPNNFEEGIARIVSAAKELCGDSVIKGAAGGIRGPMDEEKAMIIKEVTLTDWINKPLKTRLQEELGCDVVIENDAATVGLGEAHYGAGKGSNIMVYLTVSTGVGGVKIEHGVVDTSHSGFEPGKQIIDPDNSLCPECEGNTLEEYVSGTSLARRFNKKAYEIPQEDPVWDQLALWLSYGLRNTISHWSPDTIVLGGSMIVGDPRILLEDIKKHLAEVGDVFPELPELKDAELGDIGGIYGAMALLNQHLSKES